jgi:hypothetical protein
MPAKGIALLWEDTQHHVFKRTKAPLQFWSEKKNPYGKDGYSKIADLLTKLFTKTVHNISSPLAIA